MSGQMPWVLGSVDVRVGQPEEGREVGRRGGGVVRGGGWRGQWRLLRWRWEGGMGGM